MKNVTLLEFRIALRKTQKEFADDLGYEQAHISRVERNEKNLTDKLKSKIEEVYQPSVKGYTIIKVVDKDIIKDMNRTYNRVKYITLDPEKNKQEIINMRLLEELDKAKQRIDELQTRVIELLSKKT